MSAALSELKTHLGAKAPLVSPEAIRAMVVREDDDILVLNKPGWLVCHPSKHGPRSSLVGAARDDFALENVHLVSRLDRETSGLIVLARHRAAARELQMALQNGWVEKRYLAILDGEMTDHRVEVSQPLEPDPESPVVAQVRVSRGGGGQKAQTSFKRLAVAGGYTLAEVRPHTGRKHQIRAHAAWIGCPIAGDKIYGGHPEHFLQFIEHGWTSALDAALPHPRQLLHAWKLEFPPPSKGTSVPLSLTAPPLADWQSFCARTGLPADV